MTEMQTKSNLALESETEYPPDVETLENPIVLLQRRTRLFWSKIHSFMLGSITLNTLNQQTKLPEHEIQLC